MAKKPYGIEFDRGISPWPGLSMECLDVIMKGNARAVELWLGTWLTLMGEATSFATRRWAYDSEMARRCCSCKSPADLLQLQSEFVLRMVDDYMRETSRLADIEADAATAEIVEMDKAVREADKMVTAARPAAGTRHKSTMVH